MDIREAELIFEAGKETVVKTLLELHARIESLSQQVITLERKITSLSTDSTNSSKPPSSDGPKVAKPKKRSSLGLLEARKATRVTRENCFQLRR